jgi:hypothetical protein
MNWSSLTRFLVGFLLAIALLVGGGVATARYFIVKFTTPPPKPIFPNDKPVAAGKNVSASTKPQSASSSLPSSNLAPSNAASPTPKPLEPGAYRAKVVQPIGLILRDNPSLDSNQIGGIDNNEQIVVLEESADKEWQRVRVESSDRQGWVKAGNTERTN